MHNIGGVQLSAPNTSGGFHCTDEYDVMCYSDSPYFPPMEYVCTNPSRDRLFDCNHDDYFHTNPLPGSYLATKWNAANSVFLIDGADAVPTAPQLSAVAVGSEAAVFGRNADNELWYRETASGTFGAWTKLSTSTNVASRPKAVMVGSDLYVFFRSYQQRPALLQAHLPAPGAQSRTSAA